MNLTCAAAVIITGFLMGMVGLLVGALIAASKGKI
jgi:hypothetical protein